MKRKKRTTVQLLQVPEKVAEWSISRAAPLLSRYTERPPSKGLVSGKHLFHPVSITEHLLKDSASTGDITENITEKKRENLHLYGVEEMENGQINI